MKLFSPIDGGQAIMRSNGVEKQVSLFTRNGLVYAQQGSGFVRLAKYNKGTSHPKTSWVEVSIEEPTFDKAGWMVFNA